MTSESKDKGHEGQEDGQTDDTVVLNVLNITVVGCMAGSAFCWVIRDGHDDLAQRMWDDKDFMRHVDSKEAGEAFYLAVTNGRESLMAEMLGRAEFVETLDAKKAGEALSWAVGNDEKAALLMLADEAFMKRAAYDADGLLEGSVWKNRREAFQAMLRSPVFVRRLSRAGVNGALHPIAQYCYKDMFVAMLTNEHVMSMASSEGADKAFHWICVRSREGNKVGHELLEPALGSEAFLANVSSEALSKEMIAAVKHEDIFLIDQMLSSEIFVAKALSSEAIQTGIGAARIFGKPDIEAKLLPYVAHLLKEETSSTAASSGGSTIAPGMPVPDGGRGGIGG